MASVDKEPPYLLLSVGEAAPVSIPEGKWEDRIGATPHATLRLPADRIGELTALDLTDEARLHAVQHGNQYLQMTGVVSSLVHTGDATSIELRGSTVLLQERKVALRHDKVPPPEMISYLLTLCGLPSERQDIQGLTFPDDDVTYIGIVPIEGCTIERTLQVGTLSLYGRDGKQPEDTRFDALLGSERAIAATSTVRGRVTVRARTFIEADTLIRNEVDRALDWLSFRCAISEPVVSIGGETVRVSWDRNSALAMPRSSKLAYCRRTTDDAAWVQEAAHAVAAPPLALSDAGFLSQTYQAFDALLASVQSDLSNEGRSILLALHWHRRARQAERGADRLIDYWTAIEYVLARVEVPKLFTEAEMLRMKDVLRAVWGTDRRWSKIVDAIGTVNASPLPERLRAFVTSHSVPISDADYDVLWSTRRWRNHLVHGRKIPLMDERTLTKLGAIAQRMILRRAALHTESVD